MESTIKQKREVKRSGMILGFLVVIFVGLYYYEGNNLNRENFIHCVDAENKKNALMLILDISGNYSKPQESSIIKAIERELLSLRPFTNIYLYLLGGKNSYLHLKDGWCYYGNSEETLSSEFYEKSYRELITTINTEFRKHNPSYEEKARMSPILEAIRDVSNQSDSEIPAKLLLISDLIQTSEKDASDYSSTGLYLKGKKEVRSRRIDKFVKLGLPAYLDSFQHEHPITIYGVYRHIEDTAKIQKRLFTFFEKVFEGRLTDNRVVPLNNLWLINRFDTQSTRSPISRSLSSRETVTNSV